MPDVSEVITELHEALVNRKGLVQVVKKITALAEESKIKQESLGSGGVCEMLVRCLREYEMDAMKCELILWCIARLCRREKDRYFTASAANVVRLGEAGACEATVQTLEKYKESGGICMAAFRTIANLAVVAQSNKTKLRRSGACEAVVAGLQLHLDDIGVTEQGCWVITYLACDHPENKARLGLANACEATVGALIRYPDNDVVCARACGAIAFLAKDNVENTDRLIDLGACDHVAKALHRHRDNKGTLQVACHALLHLYYAQHPDRVADLRSEGALDNRGWVIEKSYEDVLRIWKPDRVVREVNWRRRKKGLCGLFICI
eukprot:gene8769-18137_t